MKISAGRRAISANHGAISASRGEGVLHPWDEQRRAVSWTKTRRGLNRIEAWADNLVAPVIHRIRSPNNNSSSLPFLANIAAVVYNSSNISLLFYSTLLGFIRFSPFIHRRFRGFFHCTFFHWFLHTINHWFAVVILCTQIQQQHINPYKLHSPYLIHHDAQIVVCPKTDF